MRWMLVITVSISIAAFKSVEYPSSEVSNQATHQRVLRREKKQIKQSKGKQAQKSAAITKSKRRKLERIKAPVTILTKTKQVEGMYHIMYHRNFLYFNILRNLQKQSHHLDSFTAGIWVIMQW